MGPDGDSSAACNGIALAPSAAAVDLHSGRANCNGRGMTWARIAWLQVRCVDVTLAAECSAVHVDVVAAHSPHHWGAVRNVGVALSSCCGHRDFS